MSLAVIASKRSKDLETKVGAVVVSAEREVLGIGWNGHPKMKWGDNDDPVKGFTWKKIIEDYTKNKHLYVCHAELNAIVHSSRPIKGSTIYVTLNPCNECAKLIVQSGVSKVIYIEKREFRNNSREAAMKIFNTCKVDIVQFSDHMTKKRGSAYVPRTFEVNLE